MKSLLRIILLYSFILFITPQFIPGLHVTNTFMTYITGGIVLSLLFLIVKPIFSIISFPINLLTLGLFSLITNAVILYILTRIIRGISITAFSYQSFDILGFHIPEISFTSFFAYIYTAFIISLLAGFLRWLVR